MTGEQAHIEAWLDAERTYAEGEKWSPAASDAIEPEQFKDWVDSYMHRALVLGLDNPLGRQALGKALRTMVAFAESAVRRFGPLPPGGVPSGELGTPSGGLDGDQEGACPHDPDGLHFVGCGC